MSNPNQPLLVVLALFLATSAGADGGPSQTWQTAIANGVSQLQSEDLFVGGMVGYLQNGSSAIWSFGNSSLDQASAPAPNAIFEIGSVTKSFTGILLAEKVVDHTLSLDGRVDNYLDEFKGTFVGGITLRQLATHTSGLPRMPCADQKIPYCFHPADPLNPYVDYHWEQLRGYLQQFAPAGYDPSKPRPSAYPYEYSNVGFGLLGYLLVKTDGSASFDAMVKVKISRPLGMPDTVVKLNDEQASRLVPGYDITRSLTPHWDFDVMAPAGALHSTASDMMKYLEANLDPDALLDQPATKNLAEAMKLSHAEGLGWDSAPGAAVIWKNGESGGFTSLLVFNKTTKFGAFDLTNIANSPDGDSLPDLPFPGNALPDELGIVLSSAQLQPFIGNYVCASARVSLQITLPKAKRFLVVTGSDGTLATLRATSPTHFILIDGFHLPGSTHLSFVADATGKITGAVLHSKDDQGKPNPDSNCVRQ